MNIIHYLGSIVTWIHSEYYPCSGFYLNLDTQWILSIFWVLSYPEYTVNIIHVLGSILILDTQRILLLSIFWVLSCPEYTVNIIHILSSIQTLIHSGYYPCSGFYPIPGYTVDIINIHILGFYPTLNTQ